MKRRIFTTDFANSSALEPASFSEVSSSLISSTVSPNAEIGNSQWISLVGGGAATIYGGIALNRSAQSLSGAVWLHHHEIPR
jgi:hypothetical protein